MTHKDKIEIHFMVRRITFCPPLNLILGVKGRGYNKTLGAKVVYLVLNRFYCSFRLRVLPLVSLSLLRGLYTIVQPKNVSNAIKKSSYTHLTRPLNENQTTLFKIAFQQFVIKATRTFKKITWICLHRPPTHSFIEKN